MKQARLTTAGKERHPTRIGQDPRPLISRFAPYRGMNTHTIDNAHHAHDTAALLRCCRVDPLWCYALRRELEAIGVDAARSVNGKPAAVVRCPVPVLHVLEPVHDEPCPRLHETDRNHRCVSLLECHRPRNSRKWWAGTGAHRGHTRCAIGAGMAFVVLGSIRSVAKRRTPTAGYTALTVRSIRFKLRAGIARQSPPQPQPAYAVGKTRTLFGAASGRASARGSIFEWFCGLPKLQEKQPLRRHMAGRIPVRCRQSRAI